MTTMNTRTDAQFPASQLLGSLSPENFMRDYWQKQALVVHDIFDDGTRNDGDTQAGGVAVYEGAAQTSTNLANNKTLMSALKISLADLIKLAQEDDVESHLEWLEDDEWQAEEGPFGDDLINHFDTAAAPHIQASTLYVHGVNLHRHDVAALARDLGFIPAARFEEVAISYATAGAYIAPNLENVQSRFAATAAAATTPATVTTSATATTPSTTTTSTTTNSFISADSKDLFVLQLQGQRAYRLGRVSEDTDSAEKCFTIEDEFIVQAGELVYLPAHLAYDSVVMSGHSISMVFSFSSLSLAQLTRGILEVALDQVSAQAGIDSGLYSNPPIAGIVPEELLQNISAMDKQQTATSRPAAIPELLLQAALEAIQKVQLNQALAARFIGVYLTEPDASAEFPMPAEELDWSDFEPHGEFVLDLKSRMLYYGDELYINGEAIVLSDEVLSELDGAESSIESADIAYEALHELANQGRLTVLSALAAPQAVQNLLLQWIDDGWLHYMNLPSSAQKA